MLDASASDNPAFESMAAAVSVLRPPESPTFWESLSLRLPSDPSPYVRYGVGIAAGVGTWLSAEALESMVGQPIVGFGIPLIAVATWFGGSRAALVALATAVLLLTMFTFEPVYRPWWTSGTNTTYIAVLVSFTAVDIALYEITRATANAYSRLADNQRQLLTALLSSDDRWRKLTDAAPAIITQTRASDGAVMFSNEVADVYTGPGVPNPRGERLSKICHPDDLQAMLDEHRRLDDPNVQSVTYEWRIRRHDGQYRWHFGATTKVLNERGDVESFVGIHIDIHDRKEAVEALALSEDRWRSLADATPAIIFEITADGDFVYENAPFRDYMGRTFVGTRREDRLPAMMHKDDIPTVQSVISRLSAGVDQVEFEWRPRRADGEYCWHLARARIMPGDASRWLVTSLDIHDRKIAEQELTAREHEFRAVVESSPAFIFRGDATGALTYASPGFYDYIGAVGEVAASPDAVGRVIHPDDLAPFVRTYAESHATGAAVDIEYRLRRRDGVYRWFLAQTVPVRDAYDNITGWVGTAIDVHDRKAAQADLEAALAAKDEFLGMVSHELRTPITTIMGNAEVLTRRHEQIDPETLSAALTDIHDEAVRLKKIIDNLLALARLEQNEGQDLEPVLLRRVVERVRDAEEREHPNRVYMIDLPDVLVMGNEVYLGQVIRNLLSNAAKYSPQKEPVSISASVRRNVLVVTVRDRGIGLDQADADRIFDPFYRSERTVALQGIGIGLAVCKRLVTTMGGSIKARQPKEGPGTEIVLALPLYVE